MKSWCFIKEIIPFFELEELAIGDTADTKFRKQKSYTTMGENQNLTRHWLVLPSHNAVSSYNGKTYVFMNLRTVRSKQSPLDGFKSKGNW
jgi:hypothetical protein